MDPLTTSQTKLSKTGFRTWQHPDETDRMYFEDRSVFGMVTTYDSVPHLLQNWETRQDQFLESNKKSLRSAGNQEKVWNAYTVHLTVGDFADDERKKAEQENRLFHIEEDFRGTRKVARANITDDEDVAEALFPLLPIQKIPQLAAENYRQRLERELSKEFDDAFLSVLNEEDSTDDIVDKLLENQ